MAMAAIIGGVPGAAHHRHRHLPGRTTGSGGTRHTSGAGHRRRRLVPLRDGPARPIADAATGVRIPIVAWIGATTWTSFHIDLVAEGVHMTGTPDHVPALAAIAVPSIDQPGYRAYPLVDHIADKTCAILERQGSHWRPSTRFKDLVDLVTLIAHVQISAEAQRRALTSEARRRGIALPERFDVPDTALWEPGYAAEARRAVLPTVTRLDDALAGSAHTSTPSSQEPPTAPGIGNATAGAIEPARIAEAVRFVRVVGVGNARNAAEECV